MKRYWVQVQAPAGNWIDYLGVDDLEKARSYAEGRKEKQEAARVVERKDVVVWEVA